MRPTPQKQERWWERAVIYQVYPRSFQDSNDDGIGDLPGLMSRLDYLNGLGVDAIWLSPIYRSPMADGGYDITDYLDVDPLFGDLAAFDGVLAESKARAIRVMMDLVPSHTSIEHPWFREDPERYIWSDRPGPANNWMGVFGGSAWSRDERSGRWYLHTFFPDQPDLNWRLDRVRSYFEGATRFWVQRGVAGFRLDAINCLMKDPLLRDDPPAAGQLPLPHRDDYAQLDHLYSQNAPDIGDGLRVLREGAGEDAMLVGEIYLPSAELGTYLEHLDAGFSFELLHATWHPASVRAAIEMGLGPGGGPGPVAWVLGNHDCPRIADRIGGINAGAAAVLLLTLPGAAVIYQGDELGMTDGPGGARHEDRAGRDPHRHPMWWDDSSPNGGFSHGDPWLPTHEVSGGGAAQQTEDPDSILNLYRDLISVRREMTGPLDFLDVDEGLLAYRRGSSHLVVINLADEARPAPPSGPIVRGTHPAVLAQGSMPPALLGPGTAFVALAT
ncbi:MAG TPA: alpha-amylase family glycosyl hydrolase [Solirubrobacterales bacterium]|nr:alpha-amylase family glycosyl hydrolase [Solirubrobacterales bacterium]